jgi:hypothetical protein
MADSYFQDLVGLSSNTINASMDAIIIGADTGSKYLVFAQDPVQASAVFLGAVIGTGQNTIWVQSSEGTIMAVTAIADNAGNSFTNGLLSFANTPGLTWTVTGGGNTALLGLSRISGLSLNDYDGTFGQTLSTSQTLNSGATSTLTLSIGAASAIRLAVTAPMNISYLDPGGQQLFAMSASQTVGTYTMSATVTWFVGLYTMSGSTASVVSSASSSSSVSMSSGAALSTSINLDGRFTNLNWQLTLRDYLFVLGSTMKASLSRNSTTPTASISMSIERTTFGATRAQVSYSVPYFGDGTLSTSAGSYNLSVIVGSGGTGVTSVAPHVVFLGS